jgi:hypothetical protein
MMRGAWIAMVLVSQACPESQLAIPSRDTTSHAAARVDFKIIIPPVLYLGIGDNMATILSNGRSVTFSAGSRTNGITLVGRRQVIVEHTPCAHSMPNLIDTHQSVLTCTVAVP